MLPHFLLHSEIGMIRVYIDTHVQHDVDKLGIINDWLSNITDWETEFN